MSDFQHPIEAEAGQAASDDERLVEVRRNSGLSLGVGALASAVAILYLSRASGTGSWLDWALCGVMATLAAAYLQAFVDARTPLLVADGHGLRLRRGRSWLGMPWDRVEALEHLPRGGVLRDGRLEVFPREGEPSAVRLSLATRVVGAGSDLTEALRGLAGERAEVLEVYDAAAASGPVEGPADEPAEEPLADPVAEPAEPAEPAVPEPEPHPKPLPRWHDPRPAVARGIGMLAARLRLRRVSGGAQETDGAPTPAATAPSPALTASATPRPLREPVAAARVEVRSDLTLGATALDLDSADDDSRPGLPEARQLRRPGSVDLVEDPVRVVFDGRVRPLARPGDVVEPLVVEEPAAEPAEDPVIGPELAAARTRLGLTVDQLADRTRIRPHVIESIEVDDFAPCGGDFYARGHLRTLARVLGIDATPLLASYAERYADAPVDPRRVFEAELASGAHGGIRGTRGGPNWSVLVAAVMVLVLAWSVARLLMGPPSVVEEPRLNGSQGLLAGSTTSGPATTVRLEAAGGGAAVTVVDGRGKVVFDGDLAFGQTRELAAVVTPVEVTSSDGSLEVAVGAGEPSEIGETGQRARRTYVER